MSAEITVEVDNELDAAYITLSDGDVVRTRRVNDEVNVDLDEMNVVVGVELLRRAAPLPLTDLSTRFHVNSETLDALYAVRNAVMGFVAFGHIGDGSVSPTTRGVLVDH